MIRLNEWEQIFASKGLTRTDMADIFRVADLNSDGVVDGNEWEIFYRMLYGDFKKCDTSGD